MEEPNRRILLVDDDPDDYLLTRALLEEAELNAYTLEWAASLEAGWQALQANEYAAVLVDYSLGARSGVELVRRAAGTGYPAPVILLTGQGSYDVDVQAMQAGADDYLNKNEVTPLRLEHTIRYAIERKQSQRLLNERNQQLAATAAELAEANRGLEQARAGLEQRVQERTRALRDANAELAEANRQLESRSADLSAANQDLAHANDELANEVRERQRVEAELREHTARLDLILSELPAILWSMDDQLRLTLLEGRALEQLGIVPGQLIGRLMAGQLGERPELLESLRKALAGEQVSLVAPSFFNPAEMMETHFAPYRDDDSKVTGVIGVSTLVTERVQAQARLAFQARLLENVTDAIVSYDNSLRLTAWNRAAEELYGWPAAEALGRPVGEVLQEEGGLSTGEHAQRRLEETGRFSAELRHRHRSGQPLDVETRILLLRDENGAPSGYVAVNRDIRERKQAEAAQKESQALFESLFDSAPDSMLLVGADGRIVRANQRALDSFRYPPGGLTGLPLEQLLPEGLRPTYREQYAAYLQAAPTAPAQLDLDLSGLRRDGSQFPIDLTLSALYREGQPQTICVIRDISHRKQAESALRDSEARFRTVFEESALGIALKDLDGRILASNPALQEMLGYSGAELRYRRFDELTHPDDVPAEQALFDHLSAGLLERYELEKRYLTRAGQPLWAHLAVSVVKDEDHRPQYLVFLVENVQGRKLIEVELAEVRRRLMDSREGERMALARDLHDGPMQELYGVVYQLGDLQADLAWMAEPGLAPAGAGGLNIPLDGDSPAESVPDQLFNLRTHVLGTIQELRNFCGALRPPTLTPFGLEATLRAHAETFQENYPEIELQLDLQPDGLLLPERVRVALFRIFQQSLANVVRHASATRVQVRFTFDEQQVQLEIEDNGRGFEVPPRWIDLVRGGHLGLAGAAERAEALGGKLDVTSRLGVGTRLKVTAPWREPSGLIN